MMHLNALRGSRAAVAGDSRRAFLRRSTALVAVAGAAAIASPAGAEESIGVEKGQFISIRKHENDHVAALVQALGANARPKPTFQKLEQTSLRHFFQLSQVLENTGVGAYLGAAPHIDDSTILASAASIALIEARHAGFLNTLLGDPITGDVMDLTTDNSFETPLTADEVATAAGGFVASLNGGPALTYSTTPSPSNDIAILNFALALEYLEAEFYNINVHKFFKRH